MLDNHIQDLFCVVVSSPYLLSYRRLEHTILLAIFHCRPHCLIVLASEMVRARRFPFWAVEQTSTVNIRLSLSQPTQCFGLISTFLFAVVPTTYKSVPSRTSNDSSYLLASNNYTPYDHLQPLRYSYTHYTPVLVLHFALMAAVAGAVLWSVAQFYVPQTDALTAALVATNFAAVVPYCAPILQHTGSWFLSSSPSHDQDVPVAAPSQPVTTHTDSVTVLTEPVYDLVTIPNHTTSTLIEPLTTLRETITVPVVSNAYFTSTPAPNDPAPSSDIRGIITIMTHCFLPASDIFTTKQVPTACALSLIHI